METESNVLQGARERARAEVIAAIAATARRQLVVDGASGLSLRAVARELGMVSSGIYRYVASRDELLTMLIVEAYDSLGAAVERDVAASSARAPAARLVSAARTIRSWAVANPNEYALVYGSPVPGYAAPQDTIGPATRVTLALVRIVAEAHEAGLLVPPGGVADVRADLAERLRADLATVRAELGVDLTDDVVVHTIAAWTQIFGLVSFELFGQTRNVINAHEELLSATVMALARVIGLAETSEGTPDG